MPIIPLTEAEISERLTGLPGWERQAMTISRTYKLDTYMAGLAFAAAVGTICEGINHHPDIHIGYKTVRVSFTTHDAGNVLTANDFIAAAALDRLGYPKAK